MPVKDKLFVADMAITAEILAVTRVKTTLVVPCILLIAEARTSDSLRSSHKGRLKLQYPKIKSPDQFTNASKKEAL